MGFLDRFKTARDGEKLAVTPDSEVTQEGFSAPETEEISESETPLAETELPTSPPVPTKDVPQPEPAPFVVFESEFAALVSSSDSPEAAPTVVASDVGEEGTDLEEWVEPLPSVAPPVLADGTLLECSEGNVKIETWLEERGGVNVYRATYAKKEETAEALGEPASVRLREAVGSVGERLSQEAMWRTHWEATARIVMLPRLIASFKNGETSYLATETPGEGPTLAQFLANAEAKNSVDKQESDTAAYLTEVLLVLTQLAAFLLRLHSAGFAHLSLRPEGIVLGKPVQVLDCSFAAPLGEPLEMPLSFAGYSAPELSHPGTVDARSDLYAIGALLYRAVTGSDVPESGADFSTWQPRIVMAGVPQILRRTLGGIDTRYNSAEELHRTLVKLKNRLRPSISHAVCGLSTIGLESSRSTNQDAFGFQSGAWETENGPVTWTAFCVADGMGGMAAGEVASEVAVNSFLRAAASWSAESANLNAAPLPAATQAQLVRDWAALANQAVVKAMEARHARGGCTLDAGLVIDRRLCIAHVGDSRLYLLRGDEFELLSRDHSFVMSLLLQGQISFEEIRTHGDRNKVTRSLGERHPQPDYFIDGLTVQKGEPSLELQNGNVLLACSDGLWEPVLESEMLSAIGQGDLPKAAREMLKLALLRGAPDNATLVLVRLDENAAPVFA